MFTPSLPRREARNSGNVSNSQLHRGQRHRRHALDLGEHPGQVVALVGPVGGHREPAVAGQHRGDAVVARRRGVGLEGELGVVVGVGVDDARGHVQAVGVDDLVGLGGVDEADLGDAPVLDGDVAAPAGEPVPSTTMPPMMARS